MKAITALLNLLLVLGFTLAGGIVANTMSPVGGWVGNSDDVAAAYGRGPVNDYDKSDWPAGWEDECSTVTGDRSYIPSTLIVANRGFLERIPFTQANIDKVFKNKSKIVRLYGVCK